jgi:hypothetical protein
MCDTATRQGLFLGEWMNARVELLIGAASWLSVFGFIAALVAEAIG